MPAAGKGLPRSQSGSRHTATGQGQAPRDGTARPPHPGQQAEGQQADGEAGQVHTEPALGAARGRVLAQADGDLLDEAQEGWLIYRGWQKAGTLESLVNKSGS